MWYNTCMKNEGNTYRTEDRLYARARANQEWQAAQEAEIALKKNKQAPQWALDVAWQRTHAAYKEVRRTIIPVNWR